MEDSYMLAAAAVLVIAQILSFFTKKRFIKLIPVFITAILILLCFVMYGCSGFTNWGYLILLVLLFFLGMALGLAWLVYGIVSRFIKK